MIKVFAPASIANFFVGFDILGFSFDQIGDLITLSKKKTQGIELGIVGAGAAIPADPLKNTASVAMQSLLSKYKIKNGFKLQIKKGIPLSSGLGGSAASAVGAVFAVNELLNLKLSADELIYHALDGEAVASGSKHADNIAPCLKGGLQFVSSLDPVETIGLRMPSVYFAIIHPHIEVPTSKARGILKPDIEMKKWIHQSQKLGSFILACQSQDKELFRKSLVDEIIEGQRKHLISGFDLMKANSLNEGAWGFTISGAGPTCFAICGSKSDAQNVAEKSKKLLKDKFKTESDIWVSSSRTKGARVL